MDRFGFKDFAHFLCLLRVVRVVVRSHIKEHRDQDIVDLFRGDAVLEGQVQMLGGVAQVRGAVSSYSRPYPSGTSNQSCHRCWEVLAHRLGIS